MRIKAINTSFMVGNALILSGQEVDAPAADAIYLISIGAAVEVQGGKGTNKAEVAAPSPEGTKEQVIEAVKSMTVPAKKNKKGA